MLMNSAIEITTILGGVCCSPKAVRNREITMTYLVKQVADTKSTGIKAEAVNKKND
ncbi:hypothetical protein PSSHI_05190 [Photobacterium sp. R1]